MAVARDQIVQTAEKYVARGKIEPAIREYRKLLADNPNDINTLNRIGDLYARIQRVDEAVDFFTQIAERYTEEGFFVKAIAIYKKIIKLNPTLLDVYERLAELYAKQGLQNEARTQFQVLADYYQKHDNAASAIGIYGRLVDLEPENPSHHVKLAEIYQQQKLFEKALGEYRTIAELMLEAGHLQEAAQVYERALAVDDRNVSFVADAVVRLRHAGGAPQAARLLSLGLERNPDSEPLVRLARSEVTAVRDAPPPAVESRGTAAVVEEEARGAEAAQPFSLDLDIEEEAVESPAPVAPSAKGPGAPAWDEAFEEAVRAAGATPVERADAEPAEPGEIELDLDEVFVLEMEEEEPASLVKPPPDMLEAGARRPAWSVQTDPGISAAPAAAPPAPPPAAQPPASPPTADEASWSEVADLSPDEGLPSLEPLEDPFAGLLEEERALGDEVRAGGVRLDPAALELTAAGLHAPAPERAEDWVTEAEVLARYGLEEKALERLADALRANPRHLEAHALLVQIHLDRGRTAAAQQAGEAMARAVGRRSSEVWDRVRSRLEAAGIRTEVAPAPEVRPTLPPVSFEPAPDLDEAIDLGEIDLDASELDAAEFGLGVEAAPVVERPFEAAPVEEPPLEEPAAPSALVEPEAEPEPEVELDLDLEGEIGLGIELPGAAPLEAPVPVVEARSPAPPPAKAAPKPRSKSLDQELAALIGPAAKPARRPAAPAAKAPAPQGPPSEMPAMAPAASAAAPPSPMPPAAPPAPAPVAPPDHQVLFDPRGIGASLDDLDDDDYALPGLRELGSPLAGAPPAPSAPSSPPLSSRDASASLDDTGISWLDEAEAHRAASTSTGRPSGEGGKLFAEDDFFDLAGELDQELEAMVGGGDLLAAPAEQTLEEIVEGFKRGVAESLSSTDFDTHFNLGIAYREMGLVDEAIGEFQLAAKDSGHLVACCSNLGLCFLEKGLPELAVKWYRRGLDTPGISEDDTLGLHYDLGCAYLAMGDNEAAYKAFVDLYGINSNYRDVVARLEELGRPH